MDVVRIEFRNLEEVVRSNQARIDKLESTLAALLHEVAELKKTIRGS